MFLAPKSASGRVLGGFWVCLVGHNRPTWPQLASQDGTQIEQKSMKNGVENQSNFHCLLKSIFSLMLVDFGGILVPSWGAECRQNRYEKGVEKIMKMMMARMALRSHMGDHDTDRHHQSRAAGRRKGGEAPPGSWRRWG